MICIIVDLTQKPCFQFISIIMNYAGENYLPVPTCMTLYSWYVDTNVLEEQTASILTYSLKLQAVCSFKQQTPIY